MALLQNTIPTPKEILKVLMIITPFVRVLATKKTMPLTI